LNTLLKRVLEGSECVEEGMDGGRGRRG